MSAKNDLEPVNLDRQTDRHDYIHTSRCILLFLGLGREIIPGKRPWRGELWGRRRTAAMRIDSPSYFLLPLPFDLLLLGTRYFQKIRTKKNLENTGIRARFGGTFGRWNGQNQGFGIGNRNALWVRDDRTSRRLSLFSLSLSSPGWSKESWEVKRNGRRNLDKRTRVFKLGQLKWFVPCTWSWGCEFEFV